MGPLIPLFWTSGDETSPLGFKARVGSALFALGRGLHNIRSLRFTYGVTPLPVYNASIAASCLPHMHVSAEVGCRDLNLRPPARQSDALPTRPRRPAFELLYLITKTSECFQSESYLLVNKSALDIKLFLVSMFRAIPTPPLLTKFICNSYASSVSGLSAGINNP